MWTQTDEFQFVKTIEENKLYEVVETLDVAGEFYIVDNVFVDLSEYDLEEEVSAYYDSVDEVKNLYGKYWGQIIAEIVGENYASLKGSEKLKDEEEVVLYLLKEYGIKVQ